MTLIALSIMLTGQWIYSRYTIEKSLVKSIYQKPWVEKVDVKSDKGTTVVFLKFKDIDNFMQAYDDIYDTLRYNLKGKPFLIKLTNEPDTTIKDASENIQFIVYEAIQTGNYTKMKDQIDNIAASNNLSIDTCLNQKNIYLKFKHGNHYFYTVFARNN